MPPTPSGNKLWRWGTWSEEAIAGEVPARSSIKLLQFNLCGSQCNQGGFVVVDATVRSILNRPADVVMLNEVCLVQADALWEKLKSRGLTYNGCFGASTGVSRCPAIDGANWYGNMVFSSGVGLGSPVLTELSSRPSAREKRNVTSMRTVLRGRVVDLSCAHLVPPSSEDNYNPRQVAEVAHIHNIKADRGPVILGGDFNVVPGRLAEIYGQGRFVEVDSDSNSPTYKRRKLDYTFLSRRHFEKVAGKVTRSKFSDHRPLLGEARFS